MIRRTKFSPNTYIGIDNGVTGSIGITSDCMEPEVHQTPVKYCLNYQKDIQYLNRIDVVALENILSGLSKPKVFIERPLVNPGMFNATLSAVRALEATLTVLDRLEIPVRFIDSKEWQKEMLPNGVKGDQLKFASCEVGKRLFPNLSKCFSKDADGILIAEWARRNHL